MVNLFNCKFPLTVFAILNVFAFESKKSAVESIDVSDESFASPDDSEKVIDDKPLESVESLFPESHRNHMRKHLNIETNFESSNASHQNAGTGNENSTNKSRTTKKSKKSKTNRNSDSENRILKYDIGPDVNVSLDVNREIVSVNIDEEYVRDILSGNWLAESDDGRKKKDKGGIMMKILPLFILPFLIQSSIMPFLVAKLKFLLVKSIIVGKLAIFLIIISAIKNSQKISTYESIPYYASEHPNRRSEAFNGYRVEGKPATWVT